LRSDPLPIGDERNAHAALLHGAFLPVDLPTADGEGTAGGAIVDGKEDQGAFAQTEAVELGDEQADLFVEVGQVVIVERFLVGRAGLGIRRAQDRPVNQMG
jgi:hypothetical protein